MVLPPSNLLPQDGSFHRLPEFGTAKSKIELLVRTGVYFHWLERTRPIDPERVSIEMPSAVSSMMAVYESKEDTFLFSESISASEKVALFLLHLEDGSFSKESLASEFNALDSQCRDFLVHQMGRSLGKSESDANDAILENPCLLLQIENGKQENILEVLLERLDQRASVGAELQDLAKLQIEPELLKAKLLTSPSFGLFCWFVWYSEGGKDDPHLGHPTFGEDRIKETPTILFEPKIQTQIEAFCSSLQLDIDEEFTLKEGERENDPIIQKMLELIILQDVYEAIEYLPKLGIIDQKAVIEIAKLCATKSGEITGFCIENFSIIDQKDRIEIAKLCAKQNGEATASCIMNFKIVDQGALFEIAKICARQNVQGTAYRIQNFGIVDQRALIEIVNICARQYPEIIVRDICKFGITDQVALIEIGKVCAKQNGESTAFYIKNFAIVDEKALVDIAKLCARQNGTGTALYIQNFAIANEKALVEIAKLCAKQNGGATAFNIDKFKIINPYALESVEILCLIDVLTKPIDRLEPDISKRVKELMSKYLGREIDERSLSEIYSEASPILEMLKKEKLAADSAPEESPLRLDYRLHHLMALYFAAASKSFGQPAGGGAAAGVSPKLDQITQDVLEKILKLGNRLLQVNVIFVLASVDHSSLFSTRFSSLLESEGKSSASFRHALPILLFPAYWSQHIAEPKKGAKSSFAAAKLAIQNTLYANAAAIINVHTGLNITILSTLLALEATPLSSEEKLHLFTKICIAPPTEAQKRAQAQDDRAAVTKAREQKMTRLKEAKSEAERMSIEAEFQQAEAKKIAEKADKKKKDEERFTKSVKDLDLLCKSGGFKNGLPDCLKEDFTFETLEWLLIENAKTILFGEDPIPLEIEEHFLKKYLKLTSSQRRPLALELYAIQIRSLGDPELDKAMTRFTKSLLKGSFKTERYDASFSLHLQTIKTSFPDLWREWQSLPPPTDLLPVKEAAGLSPGGAAAGAVVVALQTPSVEMERDSYRWLQQKLITDRDLASVSPLPAEIRSFLDSDEMLESAEELSPALDPKTPYRNMYVSCLGLCKKGISLDETVDVLKELQTLVSEDPLMMGSPWKSAIDARIAFLSTQQKKGSLEVCITDDWQDLFLSGTEVLGSCLTIDGSLNIIKCLLGFCLDGKIQMAAVKDKVSGKIKSRAFLKLLLPQEGGKPVLFFELITPMSCPIDQQEALKALVNARAKKLGIDVYIVNSAFPFDPPQVRLKSLGCPAPFEHEDMAGGIQVNGVYTISAKKVILPPA